MAKIDNIFSRYLLNTYSRSGPIFVRGKGSWLFDEKGRGYLDLFPGWGVSILGHSYPRIVRIIYQQAGKLIHLPNNLYQKEQVLLARQIVDNSFKGKVFFANSGAEAVECAIKITRLYGAGKDKRYKIVAMKNSFHGRTFAALSATGQVKYQHPFKPLLQKFVFARFNDFSSFKSKADGAVALIIELIQGEGGVNIADKEFIRDIYAYSRKKKMLFIVDEVQTGMARTGKMFCYQHYGIVPDILLLSKGLGAGFPISAVVVAEEVSSLMKPGLHASTFGGSPLACRVAREVFKIIKEKDLVKRAEKQGDYLISQLKKTLLPLPRVKEVRGRGLMIAVELKQDSFPVFKECLKRGLIINSTHNNVLRIMPSLLVKKEELDRGVEILRTILAEL